MVKNNVTSPYKSRRLTIAIQGKNYNQNQQKNNDLLTVAENQVSVHSEAYDNFEAAMDQNITSFSHCLNFKS